MFSILNSWPILKSPDLNKNVDTLVNLSLLLQGISMNIFNNTIFPLTNLTWKCICSCVLLMKAKTMFFLLHHWCVVVFLYKMLHYQIFLWKMYHAISTLNPPKIHHCCGPDCKFMLCFQENHRLHDVCSCIVRQMFKMFL